MCGIFGAWNARKAAEKTAVGLHHIQHRAKEYAGIVSTDGQNIYRERGEGLARQVFTSRMLNCLHGLAAIGHIRYSTSDDKPEDPRDNTQPIVGIYNNTWVAIAHNGNLANQKQLLELMPGLKKATNVDTELILRLLERTSTGSLEEDLCSVFAKLEGSFALLILLPDKIIAVRDKTGCKPLSIGKNGEGSYFISSETSAFPSLDIEYVCDVEAGTMVIFTTDGMKVTRFAGPKLRQCRFEAVYFASPASRVFGEDITDFRYRLGSALENECPVPGADIVTPVPDSSNFIAMGFAERGRSGHFMPAILRHHDVGRTFTAARHLNRSDIVAQKFTFTESVIRGKKIVVVDDSIVRGTTIKVIVAQLRSLGAREVHVRSGYPMVKHPCFYGVDMRDYDELIAAKANVEEIRRVIGADSLAFLSLGALKGLSKNADDFCYACLDGSYWHTAA